MDNAGCRFPAGSEYGSDQRQVCGVRNIDYSELREEDDITASPEPSAICPAIKLQSLPTSWIRFRQVLGPSRVNGV